MIVTFNSISLTIMFILTHTNTLMAVYLLSPTTGKKLNYYWPNLDLHFHHLNFLTESLEN